MGATDIETDRDFNLDYVSLFNDTVIVPGGKPATHAGFTNYLVDPKKGDQDERACVDRILACVNAEFNENDGHTIFEDFNFYVTGHSLGGGLGGCFIECARCFFVLLPYFSITHLPYLPSPSKFVRLQSCPVES